MYKDLSALPGKFPKGRSHEQELRSEVAAIRNDTSSSDDGECWYDKSHEGYTLRGYMDPAISNRHITMPGAQIFLFRRLSAKRESKMLIHTRNEPRYVMIKVRVGTD